MTHTRAPACEVLAMLRPHAFHIPVMGTGFTIDTPLKVAHLGISSVISLVDDELIEQMRAVYCRAYGESYTRISRRDPDHRARRITEYLNLVDRHVARQFRELRAGAFVPGSALTRYFELLDESPLKSAYRRMLESEQGPERAALEDRLRQSLVVGSIDVNIMAKLDRDSTSSGRALPEACSDALAALRGFAQSTVTGSLIISAGMNQRLFSYLGRFEGFFPDAEAKLDKRVVLKVTDFRSAEIQSRFLAKRGIWISEFRIESGLNCGGHAFVGSGQLLGPVLEQFRTRRDALVAQLFETYLGALRSLGKLLPPRPPEVSVTVQGGIGTAAEQRLLLGRYGVDGTGWGTPFLLVPEVTNVDDDTLQRLIEARKEDIQLSESSPLGVPFWNLMTSKSECARLERIDEGRPGSPCLKGHLALNTELTRGPVCAAARVYQRRKLEQLAARGAPEDEREAVLKKSCICHDLGGGAAIKHGFAKQAVPAICPGPNIVNFKRLATLDQMIDHIYGRANLLADENRPHVFIGELRLLLKEIRRELGREGASATSQRNRFAKFRANVMEAIEHYRAIASHVKEDAPTFLQDLLDAERELERMAAPQGSLPDGARPARDGTEKIAADQPLNL